MRKESSLFFIFCLFSVVGYASEPPCSANNDAANLIRVQAVNACEIPGSKCDKEIVANKELILEITTQNKLGENGTDPLYCSVKTNEDGFFKLPESFLGTQIRTHGTIKDSSMKVVKRNLTLKIPHGQKF